MVWKQVLASIEAVSSEGFKVIPSVVDSLTDLVYRLRWFIVGLVVLYVVQGVLPYLFAMWVGKSLFAFLSLLFL